MRRLCLTLLAQLACSQFGEMDGLDAMAGGLPPEDRPRPIEGVASDVKYIRCETCRALVTALHERMAALKKSKHHRLDEDSVQSKIEMACQPQEEEGEWLRYLDMVESDTPDAADRFLRLERQRLDGPCEKECATIRLACSKLLEEGWENELGEALWEGSMSVDKLADIACHKWSSACRCV